MSQQLTDDQLDLVHQVRCWARFVFAAGFAMSAAANLIASEPTPVALAVGFVAPFIFAVSVEMHGLLSRLPLNGLLRAATAVMVALAAGSAVVSFSHIQEVARSVSETPIATWVLPFAIDGFVVFGLLAVQGCAALERGHATVVEVEPLPVVVPYGHERQGVDDLVPVHQLPEPATIDDGADRLRSSLAISFGN